MSFAKVTVIGAGGWGTALAQVLSHNFPEVTLWCREADTYEDISQNQINTTFLPKTKLSKRIKATQSIEEAVVGADLIVLAIPSSYVKENIIAFKNLVAKDAVIVNVAKGFDPKSRKRISVIIKEIFPDNDIAVLSGPNHAEETSLNEPSATVVASEKEMIADAVQDAFMTPTFRVYTSSDVIGVELGGALKNIIALSTGIMVGMGMGDNTKAALMTRGLSEITRLGQAMGAETMTFAGLAGVGDLIVTCTSGHSRNRRCGEAIGRGMSLQDYLDSTKMSVEGVGACRSAHLLAQELGVSMPITASLYGILFEGAKPKDVVESLMTRDRRPEHESIAFK